ncbi:Splicing coactivator SRm160/300, subunit SRm160 (contains PWI domain) [Handroanthus impetiginosus]|uniref:Splicing coactivator SRm160/300, subunit SRm160 (Contains PWI domain) n=1 Tax=Handroanthus impetiginosus TaxID=429701 RepID=A0A2G9GJT4_9LAMI|nr:Splicing coactivator SRm160/300, subunit SRm160 (contains PWI domain) [Handroanthus impetiginosus]
MSGGFFRGTSADQDTRFSNKQAKLLKSQKFAPELEHLVDMTKVKMDVIKPWIAKRVTELIGFEDEVLINFIYSLLEGKAVNGKQVQISLTGFMERNTGKFMKELWGLLLSAQQNVSGVPQQFLDAKEEETRKKKAETDRIANEIQRKKEKEKQEVEQEKIKMDGDGSMSREKHAESELNAKHDAGGSSIEPANEKEQHKRNSRRRHSRGSMSPHSSYRSPSPRRKHSTSPSKSFNSRSYSDEHRRSRSISGSPPLRSRSISSERRRRASLRRSVTPRRRHAVRRSPSPWHRQSHSRRRSTSRSRRGSPSTARYRIRSPRRHRSRSPLYRRSRSPVRRRSRTPLRRSSAQYRSRTPLRRRSPSPLRRRLPSPLRHRSPSPIRQRSPSPVQSESPSPIKGRSPFVRRRSPSPLRRPFPSPRHQLPSPARRRYRRSSTPQERSISPIQRRSSLHGRKRSFTPVRRRSVSQDSSSPSDIHRNSLSPFRRGSPKSGRSPIQSPGEGFRRHEKYSSARRASPNDRDELPVNRKGARSVEGRPVVSLRSPQRDLLDQNDLLGRERAVSPSMQKSPFISDTSRGRSYCEERRSTSPRGSPYQRRERMALLESPNPPRKAAGDKPDRYSSGTSADDEDNFSSRETGKYNYRSSGKISPKAVHRKNLPDPAEIRGLAGASKSRKTQLPNRLSDMADHKEHREKVLSTISKTTGLSMTGRELDNDGARSMDKKIIVAADDSEDGNRLESEALPKLSRKSEKNNQNGSLGSPTKESDEHTVKVKEKRKHKKSDRKEIESDDYSSYDSYEERKEAKRRRKEEKKLKREERRRRREERRRRRDERRSEKLKLKSGDAGSSSSDLGRDHSEDESGRRRELRASNLQETESEQKRLEIELREKALESLRAKKGLGN